MPYDFHDTLRGTVAANLGGFPHEFIDGAAGAVHVERGLRVGGLVLLPQFGLILKLPGGFGELLLGFLDGSEIVVIFFVVPRIARDVLCVGEKVAGFLKILQRGVVLAVEIFAALLGVIGGLFGDGAAHIGGGTRRAHRRSETDSGVRQRRTRPSHRGFQHDAARLGRIT